MATCEFRMVLNWKAKPLIVAGKAFVWCIAPFIGEDSCSRITGSLARWIVDQGYTIRPARHGE